MAGRVLKLRGKQDLQFAAVIALSGILTGIAYQFQLWTFRPDGYSALSERLPYWDFTNLWSGGRLVMDGRVDTLFDVHSYREALRAWFGSALPDQEWSYPPSILLIGVPLSLLPLPLAYSLWTAATLLSLYLVLRLLKLPRTITLALLFSPPVAMNAIFGQNGALTAALLIGSLLLLPSRPIVAGILAGLLTIKPHLGLLLPFCFLAAGQYRAVIAATLTAIGLAALTALCFGADVWIGFFRETGPLMRHIMVSDYPQPYHKNALTAFIFARWLGFGILGGYMLQAATAALALTAAIFLWRPSCPMDHRLRVLLTATLVLFATPYGYSYDAIPYSIAVACFFLADPRLPRWPMALAYLWPLYLHILHNQRIGIAIVVPAAFAVAMVALAIKDRRSPKVGALGALPTASSATQSR